MINIAVGTALGDKGLVVPVIKDAGMLSLEAIGVELDDLTTRARAGQLTGGDVSGGSFTISNHGVSGSLLATLIILHAGQAATDTEFFARAEMLDTKIGQAKKDDPADVAKTGWDAMLKGEHSVVHGWKNKAQVLGSGLLSEATTAEMHRKLAEPGSGKE